jgi:glycosyltransferase involved in cell wall biosynthesis
MTLKDKRVLYISYNGMLDPLGQSQVVPYLKQLSELGVRFTLMSFERGSAFEPEGIEHCEQLRAELAACGIQWHWLRYHQKPSLPATAFDVLNGFVRAISLVQRGKIEMVHARAHIPAMIALALKSTLGIKMIFDLRGLMTEEYVEANHWRADSFPARLTKAIERRALAKADGVVTLTHVLWGFLQQESDFRERLVAHEIIPCSIDLKKFQFDQSARSSRRGELGIDDRLVLVYSGSVGSWYMTDEMADFFATLKQRWPKSFFLWLTKGSENLVDAAMTKAGIDRSDFAVRAAAPVDVPSYLSAADAGIALYQPGVARLGTSPVKVSEYLACGLPIVINAGLGDSDALITEERAGVLVNNFTAVDFERAAQTLLEMNGHPDETRHHNRAVAARLFDLRTVGKQRYAALYERVLSPRTQD